MILFYKNKKDKNKKLNIDIEEIQNNLNNSTKLTRNSTLTYNYLRNIGIYLDQFDMFLGYINTYVKNYLTYLYLGHKSDDASSTKATKVKKILDKYFDGPSFFNLLYIIYELCNILYYFFNIIYLSCLVSCYDLYWSKILHQVN